LQTRDDVYRAIFAELGFKLTGEFPYFGISVVTRVFQRVAALHLQRHPAAVDWVPTVIVELRTGGEDDDRSVTNAVATALKPLNTDRRSCRVILVLSDADTAFGLPMDEDRQKLVWVEDFTREQASLFFDNVGCLKLGERFDGNGTDLNEQLRHRVFEFIGTRPAALEFVATVLAKVPHASLDEHVEQLFDSEFESATKTLHRLFAQNSSPNGTEFQRLVRALLDDPEHAVKPFHFNGDMGLPDVATKVLKRYQALLYHVPSDTYRFHSPMYLHAARRLLSVR
jgi:hypothetical protein